MTTRQRIVVISGVVVTLLASAVIAGGLSKMKKNVTPPKQSPIIRKVESTRVTYSDINTSVSGTGRVLSQNSVDVISEVQGKLLKGDVALKRGTRFLQGQSLAKIYNTDAVYAIKSRKSSFLNSLANILPDLKIDYANSFEKWNTFFESIEISAALPPLPEISSNQEKIFLASKNILRDYYSIKSDEERLKRYTLKAPFSGSVQEVMLETGSVANPGSRIAKIIKTGELEIEVPLKVEDAGWIKTGQKAILKSDNGKKIGSGTVKRQAGYVDPANQSINIYISVLPGTEKLFAGQYLRVEFLGMAIKNAIEIPRNAIFNSNMVYLVNNGYLVKKEVSILKTNETTVILNGLEEGAELVTQPLANASENMAVQTQLSNVHSVKRDTVKAKKAVK